MKRLSVRIDIMTPADVLAANILPTKTIDDIAPGLWVRMTSVDPPMDHATLINHGVEDGEMSPAQLLGESIVELIARAMPDDARKATVEA